MIIGVDTNQLAKGSHERSNRANHENFTGMGHTLVPIPIPFGDYIEITPEIADVIKAKGKKLAKKDLKSLIKISVDRKNSIDEICGNLCSSAAAHERFRNEAIYAKESGCEFYVLVENTEGIKSVHDVLKWSNPRLHEYNKINYMHSIGKWQSVQNKGKKPPCDNVRLMKTMLTMATKYDIHWVLCSPNESADKIVELLKGDKGEIR